MIRIHRSQHTHDVPLLAATFSGGLTLPPIIRLIPEPLIEAEKLALETFNIHETTRTMVGYTPKRAVGFPAWAILTDPSNAQHALNLVADVEWARRKAKTEAGAVKNASTN
ncbi:MAG: hypothetical protein Q4D85_08740 [Corynebacterium sp.]|uniref:hypothetical protein n=1 Tax=Corynebacterium sp. TaxID=1720 RepID=UPI0026DD2E3E|nr:hypothetical protein [Corynebacterium sp.]MDO5098833.1 hypothetical protein [Corynebacterium sp.]